MNTTTKLGRPEFFLGTVLNGVPYVYTGLGTFRTAQAACEASAEWRATVFERRDMYVRSTAYGSTGYQPVAMTLGRGK